MKTLYIDNYKGFTNTFIPFLDVNFFVGENSTGKTAILNLLKLLGSPDFWFSLEFNNEQIELGYFNEIVNQYSSSKSYFAIGIEFKENERKDSSPYFWMKFKEKNSLPCIVEYMTIIDNKSVLVSLSSDTVYYQTMSYKGEKFVNWVPKHRKFTTKKKKLWSISLYKKLSLNILLDLIKMEICNKSKSRVFLPPIFTSILWFAPIRAKAQRVYESFNQSFSPEGDHIPFVLKTIMASRNTKKDNIIVDALIKFGKESSLFDNIQIDKYGKGKGAPYAINVLYDSLPIKITNVGYGVSQVMPLIVEIVTAKDNIIAIQQPEVHLHPKAQAAFGELVYESAVKHKNKFIIETHSDFTINRFRYKLSQFQDKNKVSGQVLFFERHSKGTSVTPIEINENGQYPTNMPEAYGSFFIDEELKMLEI